MRKAKQIQVWTVRFISGGFVGSFHAYTAEQAIAKAVAADRSTASTFRESQPANLHNFAMVATVEPRG